MASALSDITTLPPVIEQLPVGIGIFLLLLYLVLRRGKKEPRQEPPGPDVPAEYVGKFFQPGAVLKRLAQIKGDYLAALPPRRGGAFRQRLLASAARTVGGSSYFQRRRIPCTAEERPASTAHLADQEQPKGGQAGPGA